MHSKMLHTFIQLFRKRKHPTVPVYLRRFASIEKMIKAKLLSVDYGENLVVLDTSVHLLYMGNERAYEAFFDTLRAFINFCRGVAGIEEMTELEDRINFMVVLKRSHLFNDETGEYFNPPEELTDILLIGYYQYGYIDYAPYIKENSNHI